jgi:hypothetical protein
MRDAGEHASDTYEELNSRRISFRKRRYRFQATYEELKLEKVEIDAGDVSASD